MAYIPGITFAGGVPVLVPTSQEDGWALDPATLEAAITPRTKALFLGYPCNPTGAVLEPAQLRAVADIAQRHDLIVISDEIYDRLVYGDHDHEAFSALPGMQERTILLGGFSKAYAMTGWRVGYACAPKDLMEGLVKIHQYQIMSAPTTAQDAALVALTVAEQDVIRMVAEYDRRRRMFVDGLNRIGLPTVEPKGAFYAFPRIAGTGLTSEQFSEQLLFDHQVAVVPGLGLRALRGGLRARQPGHQLRAAGRGAGAHRATRVLSRMSAPVAAGTGLRYEAVIGIECHVQLKTVVQDVLRLLHRLPGSAAQQPHLPGLSGDAGCAAGHQPAGRPACARDRHRHRRHDTRGHALGPQELLLP